MGESGRIVILDVRQPSDPTPLVEQTMPGKAMALAPSDDLLYVVCERNGRAILLAFSMSDPQTLRRLSTMDLGRWYSSASVAEVTIADPWMYVAGLNGGLLVLDRSQPDAPVPLARFNNRHGVECNGHVAAGLDGWFAVSCYLGLFIGQVDDLRSGGRAVGARTIGATASGGRLAWHGAEVVSAGGEVGGLSLLRAGSEAATVIGQFEQLGNVSDVARLGRYGYALHAGQLESIDLSDLAHPRPVARRAVPGATAFGTMAGRLFVLADGMLSAYLPGPDGVLAHLSTAEAPGRELALGDGFAFVGAGTVLHVVDARAPGALKYLGPVANGPYYHLATDAGRLVGIGDYALYLFDFTKPAEPRYLGGFDRTYGGFGDVALRGERAWMAYNDWEFRGSFSGLEAFDVSDPSHIRTRGRLALPEGVEPRQLALDGPAGYLATNLGLVMVDLEAADLRQVAVAPILGDGRGLHAQDGQVLAGRGPGGLAVLQSVPVNVPTRTATPPPVVPPTRTARPVISPTPLRRDHHSFLPYLIRGQPKQVDGTLEPLYQMGGLLWDMVPDGDLVYLGQGPQLEVHRLTAGSFELLGRSRPIGAELHGLALVGRTVYAAADAAGLTVFDVSDSAQPVLVGQLPLGAPAIDVAVVGSLAYVAADDGGLKIVDVSDPGRLHIVGTFEDAQAARRVEVLGRHAYVLARREANFGRNLDGLWRVDVADPVHPTAAGRLTAVWDLTLDGGRLYVAADGERVQVVNVAPGDPFEVVETLPIAATALAVRGDLLYAVSLNDVVAVTDLRRPEQPLETLSLFRHARVSRLRLAGDRLLIAQPEAGEEIDRREREPGNVIVAVNAAPGLSLRVLAALESGGPGRGCVPLRSLLLCPAWGDIGAYDIADPARAQLVGPRDWYADKHPGEVYTNLALAGGYLVALAQPQQSGESLQGSDGRTRTGPGQQGGHSLVILGTDQAPQAFPVLARVALPGEYPPAGIEVAGATVFVYGYESVAIVDISDPLRPRLRGLADGLEIVPKLMVRGGVAVAVVNGTLTVLNVGDPLKPRPLATVPVSDLFPGFTLEGQLLVATDGRQSLTVVDLSDASHPRTVASISGDGSVSGYPRLDGQLLWVHGYGADVYDLADPAHPRRVAHYGGQALQEPKDQDFDALWTTGDLAYTRWGSYRLMPVGSAP
jgi:hypothetical protein